MRRAIKYPLKQEEIPINGSESGKIFSAGIVRLSDKRVFPIKLAPKSIINAVKQAIMRVSVIARRNIFLQFLSFSLAISSAQRRVTAVAIPLVAKVDAKT